MIDGMPIKQRCYVWHRVSCGHDDYFVVKNGKIALRLWHWFGKMVGNLK